MRRCMADARFNGRSLGGICKPTELDPTGEALLRQPYRDMIAKDSVANFSIFYFPQHLIDSAMPRDPNTRQPSTISHPAERTRLLRAADEEDGQREDPERAHAASE